MITKRRNEHGALIRDVKRCIFHLIIIRFEWGLTCVLAWQNSQCTYHITFKCFAPLAIFCKWRQNIPTTRQQIIRRSSTRQRVETFACMEYLKTKWHDATLLKHMSYHLNVFLLINSNQFALQKLILLHICFIATRCTLKLLLVWWYIKT